MQKSYGLALYTDERETQFSHYQIEEQKYLCFCPQNKIAKETFAKINLTQRPK
jgi:hypothetical protein